MIHPNCPHCRAPLGQFAYAHVCPHCHQKLEHNRRASAHSEVRPASILLFGTAGAAIGAATAVIWNVSVHSAGGAMAPTLRLVVAGIVGAVLGAIFARKSPQRVINQRRRLEAFYAGFDEVPGSGATARRARGVAAAA